MIIRHGKNRFPWQQWLAGIVVIVILGGLFYSFLPEKSSPQPGPATFCSAEDTLSYEVEGSPYRPQIFITETDSFMNGNTQVDNTARSGQHSSLVFAEQNYGLGYEFQDLAGGEEYEITIWRSSVGNKGDFIIDTQWGSYETARPTGKVEGEWEELRHVMKVPWYVHAGKAKAYAFHSGIEYVYFDDLGIDRIRESRVHRRDSLSSTSLTDLNLVLDDKEYAKLEKKRAEALRNGFLVTEDDDMVNARLEVEGKRYDTKVRLKGDHTDHLIGDKWSFRVKLDAGQSYDRMLVFSLQSPETRDFLSEYVYHQFLQSEGILTPRYEFVHLNINGESRGIYAMEEHFAKPLVERNHRREGPIVKWNEAGIWEVHETLGSDRFSARGKPTHFEAADPEAFGQKKINKDPVQSALFEQAGRLLTQYQQRTIPPAHIFDLDQMARFFALIDLCQAHHSLIWHNQRFYFNPVTSLLEPIGFDGFTDDGPLNWIGRPFLGHAFDLRYSAPAYNAVAFEYLLSDRDFVGMYLKYLDQYTRTDYLRQEFLVLEPELEQLEQLLRTEWPDYDYQWSRMEDHARRLRMYLYPLPTNSVRARQEKQKNGRYANQILNYHALPVMIRGWGNVEMMQEELKEPHWLDAYHQPFQPQSFVVETVRDWKYLYYEVPGLDSLFRTKVALGHLDLRPIPVQKLFANLDLRAFKWLRMKGDTVVVPAGKYQISEDLLIPAGKILVIEPGVELDLVKGAAVISRSAVRAVGYPGQGIRVGSSDGTGQGFVVLDVPDGQKCELVEVEFADLGHLNRDGWMHPGAVSIYGSEVLIKSCRFLRNRSEDGLNLVKCLATVTESHFAETWGDALDADFCRLIIDNCTFFNAGNDALDVSGTTVYAGDLAIDGAGDKGLSIGEESQATVKKVIVRNAVSGLVAKDLSVLQVEYAELSDVGQGFAAYQKKPEYGPATITIQRYKAKGVAVLHRLREGSVLELEGRQITK